MVIYSKKMESKILSSTKCAVILAFVYLTQSTEAIKQESVHNTWVVNKNVEVFNAKSSFLDKDFFLFAVCENVVNCNITLSSMNSNVDESSYTKTCNLKIELAPGKRFPKDDFNLKMGYLVDSDKVVAAWDEFAETKDDQVAMEKKLFIIDMSSCAIKNLTFALKLNMEKIGTMESYLLAYRETFDVIISDKSRCGSLEKCRITFDKEGNQVGNVHEFPVDSVMAIGMVTVKPLSSEEGFFLVGYEDVLYNDGKLAARFVNSLGKLTDFNTTVKMNGISKAVQVSASHGLFTFCGMQTSWDIEDPKVTATCNQYKKDSLAPQLNVTLNYTRAFDSLGLHNLDNGGFLLFGLSCHEESADGDCKLIVDKVLPDGKKLKSLITSLGAKCHVDDEDNIFNVEHVNQDEYCLYATCSSKPKENSENKQILHGLKKCIKLDQAFE
ncbi:hypothetical protein QAD02_009908 [Eretmocerus hayati]|uniref:Uncharacterized protein n=1 Tax=Eretmocerus hayati TaxID=131215 RepID=A0ACC2NAN9_9HYME|nr:hypothetical protein QAD02_009908 [Eretmocerus hayati]